MFTNIHRTLRITLLFFLAIAFGVFFDYFFFGKWFGISAPIYALALTASIILFKKLSKTEITKTTVSLSLLLIIFSFLISLRSSDWLVFFNVAISLYLFFLLLVEIFGKNIREHSLSQYILIWIVSPLNAVAKTGSVFVSEILGGLTKEKKTAYQIFTGVFLTVPFLILFILLFSSSDLIFQTYAREIFQFVFEINIIWFLRILWIIAVTVIVFGTFCRLFDQSGSEGIERRFPKFIQPHLGTLSVSILLYAVGILFLFFIAVQFFYLFGGEEHVAKYGLTYAQYARKGFFELIAVSLISFFLLFISEKQYAGVEEKKLRLRLGTISLLLSIEVFLIMASALKRLFLYEDAYGFTVSRIFAQLILFWIVVLFFLLLYKIFLQKKDTEFAFSVFLSGIIFLLALNAFGMETFAARKNMERFRDGKELDLDYLQELSKSSPYAASEAVRILNDEGIEREKRRSLGYGLDRMRVRYSEEAEKHWQSFNISRASILRILNSRAQELEKWQQEEEDARRVKLKGIERFMRVQAVPPDGAPME